MDRGKLHMEHDTWDLDDPAIRKLVRTLADHVIEVRDGDDVGYGIMEYGVGKGYALYGSVQKPPQQSKSFASRQKQDCGTVPVHPNPPSFLERDAFN